MIRLSIPLRQALSRLTLPVLIAAAFGAMLLGKADPLLVERLRMSLADSLAPFYAVLSRPVEAAQGLAQEASELWQIRGENARLREENEFLLRWQNAALALDLATHAYVLETGKVVMSGPADVVKNDENVRKSYLGY